MLCWCSFFATSQAVQLADSTNASAIVVGSIADSVLSAKKQQQIKKTILRSTIIPGWGQISNRQAWKLPAVAAAIGIPAYLFFDNLKEYKALKQAYIYKLDTLPGNDDLIPIKYKELSNNSLRFYRDEFRKNVDLSVLAFVIGWGLNVADAAVFANLKDFDVSDKLSMRLKPIINPLGASRLDLVFTIKNKKTTALQAR